MNKTLRHTFLLKMSDIWSSATTVQICTSPQDKYEFVNGNGIMNGLFFVSFAKQNNMEHKVLIKIVTKLTLCILINA